MNPTQKNKNKTENEVISNTNNKDEEDKSYDWIGELVDKNKKNYLSSYTFLTSCSWH